MNAAFNMFAKQSIMEQAIPFKIAKKPEIEYLDRKSLMELSKQSDKKYKKAYDELGK